MVWKPGRGWVVAKTFSRGLDQNYFHNNAKKFPTSWWSLLHCADTFTGSAKATVGTTAGLHANQGSCSVTKFFTYLQEKNANFSFKCPWWRRYGHSGKVCHTTWQLYSWTFTPEKRKFMFTLKNPPTNVHSSFSKGPKLDTAQMFFSR